jgi:predicted nucleic acid-binding protein
LTRGPGRRSQRERAIALNQIDQLSLLQKVFTEVLVPPALAREVAPSLPQLPAWIYTRAIEGPPHTAVARASLDPGESEAIRLALEAKADRIILDRQARDLATVLAAMRASRRS